MNTSDREACVELLTTTLANLNMIAGQQINGLLSIAITAAAAAHSLAASKTEDTTGADKLSELTEQLKRTAEEIAQSSQGETPEAVESEAGAQSAAGAETFCEKVEASLNLAIQNSVANQQELNTLGQAILAQAAALLFSVAGADGTDTR
jgi:hypothetical protein